MFESIRKIGEALLSLGVLPFDIAPLRVRKRKGEELLLARVIFDLDDKKLDCDPYLGCNERRLEEFLWVGNAKGQKPQLVLTTTNPEYLLNPDKKHKWAIGQIPKEVDKRGIKDSDINELCKILKEIRENFFKHSENRVEEFEKILKQKIQGGRVILYTASVRKNLRLVDLVKTNGYRKFLEYVLYVTGNLVRGRCHICGKEKEVLFEPAYPEGSILCIYNIDKTGFMSNMNRAPKNLLRTHAVCVDCKMKLRLGLRYIERELRAKIGKLNMFIIPTFIGIHESSKIFSMLPKFREAVNVIVAYEKLEEIEKKLNELKGWEQCPFTYVINILFGKPESSHFAYQHLIQNVPLTRLIEVEEKIVEESKRFAETFNEYSDRWCVNFTKIYDIFPLKVSRGSIEWKHITELFDAILTGRPYPADELIRRAVLFAKIHRYGGYELYNIRKPEISVDEAMCRGLLKFISLLNLLKSMEIVEAKTDILKEIDSLDANIRDFLRKQGYREWQAALFLLGVLVGKIGVEQYKRGDEKKSVLDKIGFDGTSADKVKVLANYVLEGLRHYRILNAENEKLYGCMKVLLDRNINRLQNPINNTFYLLSGYAYVTMKTIISGGVR